MQSKCILFLRDNKQSGSIQRRKEEEEANYSQYTCIPIHSRQSCLFKRLELFLFLVFLLNSVMCQSFPCVRTCVYSSKWWQRWWWWWYSPEKVSERERIQAWKVKMMIMLVFSVDQLLICIHTCVRLRASLSNFSGGNEPEVDNLASRLAEASGIPLYFECPKRRWRGRMQKKLDIEKRKKEHNN